MPAVHLQENSKLISGHVAEKKGYLYWVLNLTDENGKRKPKWIPTHKKVKGNKTWANNMLPTIRKEWTEKLLQEATASQQSASPSGPSSAAISFVDTEPNSLPPWPARAVSLRVCPFSFAAVSCAAFFSISA